MGLRFKILMVLAVFLFQGCVSSGMNRVNTIKTLEKNDIEGFKNHVTKVQTDPGLSMAEKNRRLYDCFMLASKRNYEATAFMIEQGVPIDYPANEPGSMVRGYVLSAAVEAGQTDIVKLLLENKGDPNIELKSIDTRTNLLFLAQNNLAIVETLLQNGANPNLWSSALYPSIMAYNSRNTALVELLARYGGVADPTPEQRRAHLKK